MNDAERDKSTENLRSHAQALLHRTRSDVEAMSVEKVQELVHELQIHQIELQMQNEALLQAQEEIEQSHHRYVDLYDFAPVGYLTINREGIVEDANLMATTLLELPRTELLGEKFSRFIGASEQDIWYMHCLTVFRTGEKQSCHLEMAGNSGARFLHVNSQAVQEHPDRARVTLNDVTMMKKLEGRLAQMCERAETANAAKSQFLANMSHEIRTPLTAIMGLGELLGRSTLSEQQEKFVSTLRMSADALLILVNELLDFSKIEKGNIELEHRPFELHSLLRETIEMASITANHKGLELTLEYDPDLPPYYFGDAHRLRQVLLNLVANAIKFTPVGCVTLNVTGHVLSPQRAILEISIIDTGIGIATDKIDRIFESFTQADASTSRKFGGTGLGLSISRNLVNMMDGEITVTSEIGHGSVFYIRLPMQISPVLHASHEKKVNHVQGVQEGEQPRILLVDDHAANILLAATHLADFGYSYDIARDGREAVDRFQHGHYSAILMDVQMPVMDGFEATAQIRAMEAASDLPAMPVIAMTAHALSDDRARCLAAGMSDYIAKPFNGNQLHEKLKEYISVSQK